MPKILVQDAQDERVEVIKIRAKEIIDQWLEECATELAEKESDTPVSEGTVMAAYMTAAYSIYHNLSKYVREEGGAVYALPQDDTDPEGN
jgi:hypothetical protein